MRPDTDPRRLLSYSAAVSVLLASFVAIGVALNRLSAGGPTVKPAAAANRSTRLTASGADRSAVGSIIRLQPRSGQPLWIAANAAACVVLRRAQAIHDEERLRALSSGGWVYTVDDETQARIVDTSPGCYRVRILEGDAQGKTGWVPVENAEGLPARRGF
jgi:hypothetical protein